MAFSPWSSNSALSILLFLLLEVLLSVLSPLGTSPSLLLSPQKLFYYCMVSPLCSRPLFMASSDSSSSNPSSSALRIIVERNPSQSRLSELNVKHWPKWGCSPGKYQLRFEAEETCYLVRGKVKAYPKGSPESEFVEFGAGDLVTIPKGLSCTWDVSVAVDKFYKFESSSSSSSNN